MQSDTIRPSTQAIPRWLPIPVHALMSRYLVSCSMTGRSYPMRRQTRSVDDQSQLCIQQQQLTNLLAFVECWPLLRTFSMQQKGKTQPSGQFRMANNPLDRLEACQILGLVGLSLLFGWSEQQYIRHLVFVFYKIRWKHRWIEMSTLEFPWQRYSQRHKPWSPTRQQSVILFS